MCEGTCDSCKNYKEETEETKEIQKRRQIQVSYNSGGYSITITSDYEKEDIDFLSNKAKELIKNLRQRSAVQ